jgi:hypothetical protein
MAIDLCVTPFVRFFGAMVGIMVTNWGWTITIGIGAFVLQGISFALPILADGLDFVMDIMSDLLVSTFLGFLFFTGLSSIIMGLFWMTIGITSQANIILKVVSAPFLFLVGGFIGAFPVPLPGLTFVLKFGLDNKATANIFCFAPLVLFVIGLFAIQWFYPGQNICSYVDTAATLLI